MVCRVMKKVSTAVKSRAGNPGEKVPATEQMAKANKTSNPPTAREIDTLYASFLSLSSLFTAVVACLAVLQLYYVYKYVSNTRIQADLYYLVLMFPDLQITTVCNLAGMFIPRAAPFLYAVALIFYVLSLRGCVLAVQYFWEVERKCPTIYWRGSNQTIDSFMTPAIRVEPEAKITFDPIVGETLRVRRNSENPVLTV
ncbi:hypothetical protein OSTOST_08275 [Ostertagia ostertagi]